MLDAPRANTLKGKRDRAILAVLLFHALRRAEVSALKVKNFDVAGVKLRQVQTATFEGYNEKIKILNSSFNLADGYRTVYGDQAYRSSEARQNSISYQLNFYFMPMGF